MTIADAERQDALIYIVASDAFRDDVALSRWSATDGIIPHLRLWLNANDRWPGHTD